MNFLRSILRPLDRRERVNGVEVDRRVKVDTIKSINGRIDSAIEDLHQTVSMSRKDFCEMIQREGDCLKDKH